MRQQIVNYSLCEWYNSPLAILLRSVSTGTLYVDDAALKLAPSPTITMACSRSAVVHSLLRIVFRSIWQNNVPMVTKYVM